MATALSIALKDAIDDNWVVGSGGAQPIVYGSDSRIFPKTNEWIRILGWTFDMGGFQRLNEKYIAYSEMITFEVSTKNHADKESRLDEMVNELRRIITPTNLTGYHLVDITGRTRRPSDQTKNIWAEQMTVKGTIKSASSAITPGSRATSDLLVDTLEFSGGGGQINAFHDEDNMVSDDADGLASQQSIKAFVPDHTLDDFNEVTFGGPANKDLMMYDGPGSTWDDVSVATMLGEGALAELGDVTVTAAQLEDLLMFKSANAAYVPCVYELDQQIKMEESGSRYSNVDDTNNWMVFILPIPYLKGSLKLHTTGVKIGLYDADAGDFITRVITRGHTFDTVSTINDNTTDRTAQAEIIINFGAADLSGYDRVVVHIQLDLTDANDLDIAFVAMNCYYDT